MEVRKPVLESHNSLANQIPHDIVTQDPLIHLTSGLICLQITLHY